MNDGVKATTNCGCIAGKDCMVDKYAQRVIWKGEEINCSYAEDNGSLDSLSNEGWKEFGLL
eukprot:scaffold16219_cov97-Skeletonema_dohrnii-CCMP3373.AAC.1